jgi:hypothetical protein
VLFLDEPSSRLDVHSTYTIHYQIQGLSEDPSALRPSVRPTRGRPRKGLVSIIFTPYPWTTSKFIEYILFSARPCQAWVFILTTQGIRKRGYSHEVPAALNVPEHAISSIAFQGKCLPSQWVQKAMPLIPRTGIFSLFWTLKRRFY